MKVGKHSCRDVRNGKNYNVERPIAGLKAEGKTVVMDRAFPTIKLLKDAKTLWNTRIIAT